MGVNRWGVGGCRVRREHNGVSGGWGGVGAGLGWAGLGWVGRLAGAGAGRQAGNGRAGGDGGDDEPDDAYGRGDSNAGCDVR